MRMKYFNLKFLTFFLTALLAFGVGWADEVVAYTLTPERGTNNSYTGNCDIEIDGITWNLTGNSQQLPWRIGGKSISKVDRTLYSKTSISENVSKIEVKHGAASSITVNSWTVIVSKNSDFSNPVSSLTPTFSANSTTTITRPDGADWSNCYFKFVYNVTVSGTSNKFLEFSEAKFYDLSGGSVTPTCATPTFSPAGGNYNEAQNVTISCATDGAAIHYTTDGSDPDENSVVYSSAINVDKTMTIKAIAMKGGMDNSAIASATYTFPTVVTNLAGANNLGKGTEFVYNGYAVVTHVVDNNQYQNADVWIRDDQGNAAYLFRAEPLGFQNGDVLKTGWTATKDVYYGLNELKNVTMVKDGTAEAKPEIATEIKDTDVSKFVRLESISTIGNDVQWYDKFGTGETLDPNKTYNVEGIVGYNDGLQFYPITVEEIGSSQTELTITLNPAEKTATVGETITVTVTTDSEAEFQATCDDANATVQQVNDGFTITSSTAGTYTVSVYATDGVLEKTVTGTYTFTAAPEPGTYCPAVIEFDDNGSDDQNTFSLESFKNYIINGKDFVSNMSCDKVYPGATGIKFSSSKGNGYLTINLANLSRGSWATTKIIVNAKKYGSDDAKISVNDSEEFTLTSEFADYEFPITSTEPLESITIDATKRMYVKSITIMHECGDEPVIETVAKPTFEPAPQEEAFTTVQNVTITCATVDAAIHYTTDGTEPTAQSPVYSQPIVVNDGTTTIKAIAMKEGMTNSEVASATYTVNLPTLDAPTFDHESNIYDDAFEVTIVAAEGATIHYTTDGNEPTAESAVYKDRIPVNKNMTIKAIAVKEGYKTSAVATAEYQIKVAKPTFSPVPGTFDAATQVSIVCGTEGATIHYTTDGTTEPTAESPVYSQPIAVNSGTMTIKAIAIKKDMTNSDIAEGVYTIKQNAGLDFKTKQYNLYVGVEFTAPTLEAPEGLTVTYESSNTNVAEVNAETGAVTIKAAGEATITASWEATDTYTAGSTSYTITVENKPVVETDLEGNNLDLVAVVGKSETGKIIVSGENLKGDITLTLNDTKGVFAIDVTSIAKEDAIGEVTVTYTPKAATGEDYDEAIVTITSTDAETVTVTLTGMATLPDPELSVSTKTLEMGTEPTGTFTVTGQHLTENVTLTVTEGTAANFEISPATIIPDEEGKVSQEVTVTYKGNSTEDEYATITVKSGTTSKEVIVTARVLPTPEIIADPESLTMAAKVGETATATFTVMGTDLKEVVTLTLNDANGVYTINPESNISIKDAEEGATVTVTYKPTAAGSHKATISVTTKDAETATVTLAGTATVPEVVAMPTFSLVAGSYTGPQQVIIYCATEGATISYSTDGGQTWKEGNTVNVDKDMTIMAKASKDGYTISETATGYYVIDIPEALPTDMPTFDGYYSVLNSGKYANIQGRKTLTFTDAPDAQAGTVIRLKSDNTGKVEVLRSQAADLQRYADRAMSYVPEVVKIVAKKLNADGSGEILGETGLNKILEKFNECFDHNLHVEQAEGGYRLYGKTPSMQPVVEFYRENKDKVEAKLPNLEAFINSALEKLKAKIGGSSVFTPFSLLDIWEKMGGTLTKPTDDASTMAFYREVLNNKNYVWDFAYQTAMIYVNNLMSHPRWPEVEEYLGEYAQYIDKIDQIRPEFKYYIVQKDGKPDFISEGNKDIIDNNPRTIWTLEPRTDFTVNFPEANKHNGEYVTTLYTDFAYTLPKGVTAYTVTEVSTQGVATLTALEGTIPAQTPVLLKSTAAGPQTVTLSTEAGTAPADNLLVGPDYLIKHYEFKTPQVVDIFNFIKDKLPGFYDEYVAQYEYLMLKTAGTVGNKYFWNVNSDLANLKDDCIVRSLAVDENGTLAFSDHWTTETNKAFLVDDANNPQDVIKLPSLRGDINKDGVISITDVTALIDILLDLPARNYLQPTDTYPKGLDYEAADVNENKDIEITDVTTLIDILLNMPDQPAQGSGN